MKEIILKRGHVLIVDEDDFERVNNESWAIDTTGYAFARPYNKGERKTFRLHRFIMNAKPGEVVDHINGDKLDNRKENLRITDRKGNSQNRKKSRSYKNKSTSSKYKGVSWHEANKKWRACIYRNNKSTHLGYFEKEIEAAKAYNLKAIEYHGEFARLNEI